MKIRLDYVTNSSSSSYIVTCKKVNDVDKLKEYLAIEFGKYGDKIAKSLKCFTKEELINAMDGYDFYQLDSYDKERIVKKLEDDGTYIYSEDSDEGMSLSETAILSECEGDFIESIYNSSWISND